MSTRGAGGGGLSAATAAVRAGANPADVLANMGLIKLGWGDDPEDVAKQLLEILVVKGFLPKPDGARRGGGPVDNAARLAEALRNLQAAQNLPRTGTLDDRTIKVVEQFRPATGVDARADTRSPPPAAPPTAERPPVNKALRDATRTVTAATDTHVARRIQDKASDYLDPPRPTRTAPAQPPAAAAPARSSSSATASPPPAQPPASAAPPRDLPATPPSFVSSALARSSPASPASPASGPPPAAAPPPATQAATAHATPPSAAATSLPANPAHAHPVAALATSSASTSTTAGGPSAPTQAVTGGVAQVVEQQVVTQQVMHDAQRTVDVKQPGSGNSGGQESPGGRAAEAPELHRGDAPEHLHHHEGHGNQATGDERTEDKRRGNALVDDGSGKQSEAYEVPSLEVQVHQALGKFEKEEDAGNNRPTTYAAEFVLFKPGIYQGGTMAPNLLNLKVDRAMIYDEVWMEAIEEINKRLRRYEPACWPLTFDDVHNAMQRARARAPRLDTPP